MTTMPSIDASATSSPSAGAPVLVCLPSMTGDVLEKTLGLLSAALPEHRLLVASPDRHDEEDKGEKLRLVPYTSGRAQPGWVLTAGDYLAASMLAKQYDVETVLLLGEDAGSITAEFLQGVIAMMRDGKVDVVVSRPTTEPTEGLVTSAVLYPLTRALFGADIRFPLPLDLALSARMAERLTGVAQKHTTQGATDAFIWPIAEAAVAGFSVRQVNAVGRRSPQPSEGDFSALFTSVAGSMFYDLELKATFWQRARSFSVAAAVPERLGSNSTLSPEVPSMVESYRRAYNNLHEIWALVCPPQSLLALKKLSLTPVETFAIAPNLWARIVYDFVLAFHLRTINRSHLLGAFTPLYLAWVASFLRTAGEDDALRAAAFVEETAAAFETEKPYLVSRWRWPDRFNP